MKTNRKHFSKHLAPFYMKRKKLLWFQHPVMYSVLTNRHPSNSRSACEVNNEKLVFFFFTELFFSLLFFVYASNFVHLRCWNTCLTYKVYSDVISVHMLSLLSFLRILIYIHHLTSFQPLHSDKNNTLKGQINQKLDLSLLFLSHFKVTKC